MKHYNLFKPEIKHKLNPSIKTAVDELKISQKTKPIESGHKCWLSTGVERWKNGVPPKGEMQFLAVLL